VSVVTAVFLLTKAGIRIIRERQTIPRALP
jgi:hypothetical protein